MKKLWTNAIDMPPVWLVFYMAIAWLQSGLWNPAALSATFITTAGWILVGAGILLMTAAIWMFLKHKTPVVPKRTPANILTRGPYALSRNPIYLADTLILTGFILTIGATLSLLLVPIFVWTITKRFIEGEESHILAEFGDEYATYCKKTRRWI